MDKEIWAGETTDGQGFHVGNGILTNVHSRELCKGRSCVLHNPSEHHMRSWPTLFRADLGFMERICPHGVGHPDPDDLEYQITQGRGYLGTHGCDGCCWEE